MITQYPEIAKAALMMARSNGSIHRLRSEDNFLEAVSGVLAQHQPHELAAIDNWLASRTEAQVLTLVDGEQSEMEAELVGAPEHTNDLLNDIWQDAV